ASLRTWMVGGGGRGQMAVYYGVVKNNQVVFDDEVHLADGVRVEVRPRVPDERGDSAAVDTQLRAEGLCEDAPATEEAFKRHLRATGALAPVVEPGPAPHDRRLIDVTGQPLSEQIIAERR